MRVKTVLFSFLVISLMSSVLFADTATDKGKFMADVNFYFFNGTTTMDDGSDTESDDSGLDVAFYLGYFIMNDLEVGAFTEVDYSASEIYDIERTTKSNLYGLFARYYLMREMPVRPFAGINAGIGTSTSTETDAEDMNWDLTFVIPSVGVSYFINEHVGFHLAAAYNISSYTEDDDLEYTFDMDHTHFGINLGTSISF